MLSEAASRLDALFVAILVVVPVLLPPGSGFNLDVQHESRVILAGSPGSYFGFTVTIVGRKGVFVGSPRGNDTTMPNTERPGGVHRCTIDRSNGSCTQIDIDSKTGDDRVEFRGTPYYIKHGKDNQWLGGTLEPPPDGSDRGLLTCAPRWYNRIFVDRIGSYFMNGMCYEIPLSLRKDDIQILPLTINGHKQTFTSPSGEPRFDLGMAGLGMSAHFTKQGSNMIIGAPGIMHWTGGFVDVSKQKVNIMQSKVENVKWTLSELLGSSASSGAYFNDRVTYFVFGAPRANLTGKVVLFKSNHSSFALENMDLEIFGSVYGQPVPMNSYFGGSLCTVDVNKDGFDDLLVGAPLFSSEHLDGTSHGVDEGRVFLYLGSNNANISFEEGPQILSGREIPGSRFGTAIASLRDISNDGYNDVIVGAPYEDDNQGAVYIYNGYKDGLWPMFSQKVTAAHFNVGLKGFGISIATAYDINSDTFNDVAIGSYLSDQAVVLYGQPVINMDARFESGEDIVDTHGHDFTVTFCFQYDYRLCEYLSLHVILLLDATKSDNPRLVFSDSNQHIQLVNITVFNAQRTCTTAADGSTSVKSTNDLVTPIVLQAEYQLDDIRCSTDGIRPTINRFNGDDPGDPLLVLNKTVHFRKDCPNNNCQTDLHLSAEVLYTEWDGYFVIGTSIIEVKVNVTKTGNPSYGSTFQMAFPESVKYRRMQAIREESTISCSLKKAGDDSDAGSFTVPYTTEELQGHDNETMVVCSFGNPMYNDSGVEFSLFVHVPDSITVPDIRLRMTALTLSTDPKPSNNVKELIVQLRNHVNARSSGVSVPDTVFIRESTTWELMTHIYELENRGPSPLPWAMIHIRYPQIQGGKQASLYLNATEVKCRSPCIVQCSLNAPDNVPPVHMQLNGRVTSPNIRNRPDTYTAFKSLNCSSEKCSALECSLQSLLPKKTIVISLELVVLRDIEGILQSGNTLRVTSKAEINLDQSNLIAETKYFQEQVSTLLAPSVVKKEEVKWWIIIVSAIIGILLLVLIAVILYKVGFFKRKMRDELERKQFGDDNKHEKSDTTAEKSDKASINHSYTDSEHDLVDKEDDKQNTKEISL